jgi:hypothetical protein
MTPTLQPPKQWPGCRECCYFKGFPILPPRGFRACTFPRRGKRVPACGHGLVYRADSKTPAPG